MNSQELESILINPGISPGKRPKAKTLQSKRAKG